MHALWMRLRLLARMNWMLNVSALLLLAFGFLFVYSAAFLRDDTGQRVMLYQQQIRWALLGAATYFGLALCDYRRFRSVTWWCYVAALVLLLMVLVFGVHIGGARRWLSLPGVAGMTFQPSELAKIAVVIAVAQFLGRAGPLGTGTLLAGVATITLPPVALIVLQPDIGTAAVMLPVVWGMAFAAGLPLRWVLAPAAAGLLLLAIIVGALVLPDRMGADPEVSERIARMTGLREYQRERILVFVYPDRDPLNRGWSKRQSQIAIGSGGIAGKGFLEGTQNILGFLPRTVAPTDFIFSVIAEETGFRGAVTVLGLFSLMLYSIGRAALRARDKFGRLLCAGTLLMLFVHIYINIGMTIGVMPVTGLPLPMISYGGSFMMGTMALLGLVQSVYIRRIRFPSAESRSILGD